MATITFAPKTKPETATAVVVTEIPVDREEVSLAIATPTRELATSSNNGGINGIEGEITSDDLRVPRVNLVQRVGILPDHFAPGSFLFQKEVTIAKPGTPFTATVLRLKKYFQEKIEFGSSNEMPRRANTSEEVRAMGGSLMYGHPHYFQDVADILLAVKAPADLSADDAAMHFPYNDGENLYGLAMYTVAASAFTSLGKKIITDASYSLRSGLYQGIYEIGSELRKNASNSWYVPVGQLVGKHSPEKAEFFKGLVSL
jgi:hypothetical protein